MRANLAAFQQYQVFLNYPFDEDAESLSMALHFAVVAAGLLPVCAMDMTSPDKPRLSMLVDAITSCQYSAHDLSRCTGEGNGNLARFNMPVEMGMALFHALHNQSSSHRCAFFVTGQHDYKRFASDLSGLDPYFYDSDDVLLLRMYEWLRDNLNAAFITRPSAEIGDIYSEFKTRLLLLRGAGKDGRPSHHESQELMYQIAAARGLWDWRANRAGQLTFKEVPLSWK
jgi:hypothetical protein